MLHLKDDPNDRLQDSYRKHCSTSVQLSRLYLLTSLHLLQPLDMSDLRHGLDPKLLGEQQRFQALKLETLTAWQTNKPS